MTKYYNHIPKLYHGDCLGQLHYIQDNSIDLIYLDPPFFTQKIHSMKMDEKEFKFSDIWNNSFSYGDFLLERLKILYKKLSHTGSIFVHCDDNASHIIRFCLDAIFGADNFQSEIIWTYKRWSNSKKGLLSAHQNIFFYSKSKAFKFNPIMTDYSLTTNIDQIMQKRTRDIRNKSVYAKDANGDILNSGAKKGVPLSDVWDIPYLNPKAKERVGYPTQKPISLLERIINLTTDEGDIVLDPFMGSGTTLIASMLNKRHSIGIDISRDALNIAQSRIENPIKTESHLMKKGKEAYHHHNQDVQDIMKGIKYIPIQRNKGIDALLTEGLNGKPIFLRVQRESETLEETAQYIEKAIKNKGQSIPVIIATQPIHHSLQHISPSIEIFQTSSSKT